MFKHLRWLLYGLGPALLVGFISIEKPIQPPSASRLAKITGVGKSRTSQN